MLRHKKANYAKRGQGVQGWEELINAIGGDYGPLSNSAAETIITPDFNIPRFYLAPGRVLRYLLTGTIGTSGAALTVTFRVRWGGVAGLLLNATAPLSIALTAAAANSFRWEGEISCRAAGPAGSLYSSGHVVLSNRLSTDTVPALLGSNSSPNLANPPVVVDTVTDKLLSFTGQLSVANAANTITVQQALLEALN